MRQSELDYEGKKVYRFNVIASDGTDDSLPLQVTITVLPDEESPEFKDGERAVRTVPENTAAGQDIGVPVLATDPEGDDLTYSVTPVEHFDIDPDSGQLKTSGELDYEMTPSYSVTVSAGDTDAIAVTIVVTDVNEAPRFTLMARRKRHPIRRPAPWMKIPPPVQHRCPQ